MRFQFEQIEKTSLVARFTASRLGQQIGEAVFEGWIGSDEGNWSGWFMGHDVKLLYARGAPGSLFPDAENRYDVLVDGRPCGLASRDVALKAAGASARQFQMQLDGRMLAEYPFARGRKGFRYPIFDGLHQIAELSKGCKVKSDLHSMEAAVASDSDALAAFLFCCYTYTQSWWQPGPAAKGHTHLYIQRKTSPAVGDAYDERFMDAIAD